VSLVNLTLDGNALGGSVLRLNRCNEVLLDNSRFRNTTGNALWATQLWNSRIRDCFFTDSGTDTTSPAVLLDSVTGIGSNGGCSVVTFVGCQWENSGGVPLKITGSVADSSPCDVIQIFGGKIEHSHGSYVLVDLAYVQQSALIGVHFTVSNNNHVVDQTGTSTGFANKIIGCSANHAGSAPTYLIDHTVGLLLVADNTLRTSVAAPTAFYHVGSAVASDASLANGNLVNYPAALYKDDRAASGQTVLPSYGGMKDSPYSASMTFNCNEASIFRIAASNGTAFTINNPTNPKVGMRLVVEISNGSGGVLGAVTWGSSFLLAGAFVAPANGKSRTIEFYANPALQWVELSRAAADI
jgi:hypothetical protein